MTQEIRTALDRLFPRDTVIELRALNTQRGTVSGYFDDHDTLARAASRWSGRATGVYVTLNAVDPALLARSANRIREYAKETTRDQHILRRRHLLFDFDPVRPSGISATEDEHDAALHRMIVVRFWLRDQGWPDPIIADSGNGGHLVYAIDLPNDADSGALVERCLKALDFRFSDARVVVDTSTGKAAQLWKVPGTWAQKGDNLPERPHRRATLLSAPEALTPVTLAHLEALAGLAPSPQAARSTASPGGFDLAAWIERHRLSIARTGPWNGGRKWILSSCPFNPDHTDRSAYILQFPSGAIAAGCHHRSCAGKDWHALRDQVEGDSDLNSELSGNSEQTPPSEWEPPLPLHELHLPTFPTETLPDWLRDYVQAKATATQTPQDLPAMVTLGTLSAACAKLVEVEVTPEYVEPVNIYCVTAMDPGTRKSAVFADAVVPLEDLEEQENRRRVREIKAAELHRDLAKQQLIQAELAFKKAKPQERPAREQEVQRCVDALADITIPPLYRLLADDITPEKLTALLAEQQGRIALMSAEGDLFDMLAGRYSSSGIPNFTVFLKGHAGDTIRVDRIGRPPDYVKRPTLTVCLTLQPDVLRGLSQRPGFRGRGLLGRFLYALPENLMGRRRIDPPPVLTGIVAAYREKVTRLLELALASDAPGFHSHRLRLTDDARDLLRDFERQLEPRLRPLGDLAHMTDWASKLTGAVARVAGLLHMATHVRDEAPWEVRIDSTTVEHAIDIGQYLLAHAKAAYVEMGTDPEVEGARHVVAWLISQGKTTVSLREIFQGTKGRFRTVATLRPALAILVEHGFIRDAPQPVRPGPGRRPSAVFEVNPWVGSHYSHNPQNRHRPVSGEARANAPQDQKDTATMPAAR